MNPYFLAIVQAMIRAHATAAMRDYREQTARSWYYTPAQIEFMIDELKEDLELFGVEELTREEG